LSTLKPPHNNVTILSPTTGKAVKKLVITVAAQKLICPQTRTYPRKAVAIIKSNITTPKDQTRPLGAA